MSAAALGQTEFAFKDKFRVQGWDGEAVYTAKNNRFRFCVVRSQFEDGTQLSFVVYESRTQALFLRNRDWRLPEGQIYNIEIRIDAQWIKEAEFFTTSETQGRISINHWTFEQLRRGRHLTIVTPNEVLKYSLKGTFRALDRLLECRNSALRYASRSENPFSRGGSAERPSVRPRPEPLNPFNAPRRLAPDSRQSDASSGKDLEEIAKWATDFYEAYKIAIDSLNISTEIDELTFSLFNNQISKEYAGEKFDAIGKKLISRKIRLIDKLGNMHQPDVINQDFKNLVRRSTSFLETIVDEIDDLLLDSKSNFDQILAGEKINEIELIVNRLKTARSLINLESNHIKIARFQLEKNHPQYWMNTSIIHINDAVVDIFQALEFTISGDSEKTKKLKRSVVSALAMAEDAIDQGEIISSNLEKTIAGQFPIPQRFRGPLGELEDSFIKSFQTERDILSLIRKSYREAIEDGDLSFYDSIEALGTRRAEQQNRRLKLVGKIGILFQQ